MFRRTPWRVGVLLALTALATGCQSSSDSSREVRERELVVFAAASLTDAFTALERDFEAKHQHIDVKLNFAGSQSLRTQIHNGATPQVFASANSQHMDALAGEGLVIEPAAFVENALVIVVPRDNPAGIQSLADLPKAKRLVLAGKNVPAGAYAEQMLARASKSEAYGSDFASRVQSTVVSRETHVRQTLQKVVLGEADAALVYATDAHSAGDKVLTIELPRDVNVIASYPIATVKDAPHTRIARNFVSFVKSDEAAARFKEFGFRPVGAD